MLPRHLSDFGNHSPTSWQELAEGAPTIIGFAQLCSLAISDTNQTAVILEQLSDEAKCILGLAASRGTLEIWFQRDGFDSVERFLAVCVEVQPQSRKLFLRKEDPQQTVKFLDGFRQLCRAGLVLHHLQRDFSLSKQGFELARLISVDDYQTMIDFAIDLD